MQQRHCLSPRAGGVCLLGIALGLTGCNNGINGHQVVQNRVVVAGGAVENVRVDCPSGKKVLGGGFGIETPDAVKVFTSEPSDGSGNTVDNGWTVTVRNSGSQGRQTTVYAVCADAR